MTDRYLIKACEQMIAAHGFWPESLAWGDDGTIDEAHDAVFVLVKEIEAVVPTTMAGVDAKANASFVLWCDGEPHIVDQNDETSILTRSLVRDLANRPK